MRPGRSDHDEWRWLCEIFSAYCGVRLAESMVVRWLVERVRAGEAAGFQEAVNSIREQLHMFMEEDEIADIVEKVRLKESGREERELRSFT